MTHRHAVTDLFDGEALGGLVEPDHRLRGADLEERELGVARDGRSERRLPAVRGT